MPEAPAPPRNMDTEKRLRPASFRDTYGEAITCPSLARKSCRFERKYLLSSWTSAETPKVMFEGPYLNVPGVSYDVAPDGRHFVMIEENQKQAPTTQLNIVLNWFEELKRRVPAGKK